MKKITFLILLGVSTTFAYAQNKETRSLSNFTKIVVGESVELELVKGSSNKAVIEVSGADTDDVETKVSGEKLTVGMVNGSYRNVKVKATVTYTSLEAISVNSSAKAYAKDKIKASSFRVSVSSSGYASLVLDVDQLDVSVSSSGEAKLEGSADEVYAKVSSSGDIRAYNLTSRDVDVSANSSGRAEINVSNSLEASANSSGKVVYRGSPDKVNVSANSAGKVVKG